MMIDRRKAEAAKPGFQSLVIPLLMVATIRVIGEGPTASERSGKPNVLILFADDQRADTIAALGNSRIRTPNIDSLASRGTAFTRAYCMGSQQGAVCIPSRAMLLTGRSLFRVKDNLEGQPTWPEAFAREGYETFLTGKWHNQEASALRVFQRGTSIFLGGMGDPYNLPIQDISADHTVINKRSSGEHSVKLFADAAAAFLSSRDEKRPFLCYVAFNLPHDPRVAPAEYHARYNREMPPLPSNFLPIHPFDNGEMTVRDEALAPWPRTPELVRQNLADYYAAIEFLDAQIGRILDALKASGQLENTLIVFAADHGLAIGSHGLFGKQNLYDHSMRAPLVIAGPGVPHGRKESAFAYLFDMFPTLGEVAGIMAPEGSEGISLWPILDGRRRSVRDSVFTSYGEVQRAVRDDRWKLIVYPKINKTQLFDLENDPAEIHDLADHPAHAGEARRLTCLLREWQGRLDDALPLSTTTPRPSEFRIPETGRSRSFERK